MHQEVQPVSQATVSIQLFQMQNKRKKKKGNRLFQFIQHKLVFYDRKQ